MFASVGFWPVCPGGANQWRPRAFATAIKNRLACAPPDRQDYELAVAESFAKEAEEEARAVAAQQVAQQQEDVLVHGQKQEVQEIQLREAKLLSAIGQHLVQERHLWIVGACARAAGQSGHQHRNTLRF